MVRCADCGLLGLRSREDDTVDEASAQFRLEGRDDRRYRPKAFNPNARTIGGFGYGDRYDPAPICRPARVVFPSGDGVDDAPALMLEHITAERECSAFVQWQRGKSPAEHEAMMQQQLDVERDERRHGEMMGVLKMQLWIMGVGMIVTTLLAAVVASLISAALK